MKHSFFKILPVVILFFLLFVLINNQKDSYNIKSARNIDLAKYSLMSFNEKKIIKLESIKEETYAINIFSTGCEACVREYPELLNLPKNLVVYGVSYLESLNDLEQFFLSKENIYKDIFIDETGDILFDLGAVSFPEIFIIHKNKVVYNYRGMLSSHVIQNEIEPLMRSLGL